MEDGLELSTALFVGSRWVNKMGREKGPGRHDTWFRVICIWNHLLKMAAVIGFSFKERFLRFQLLFPDFYHFHHVIWRVKWAKRLKTEKGQNMSSGPFLHDAAQILLHMCFMNWSCLLCPWTNFKRISAH